MSELLEYRWDAVNSNPYTIETIGSIGLGEYTLFNGCTVKFPCQPPCYRPESKGLLILFQATDTRPYLDIGADAVQVGTRFIAATECTAHATYKEKLIKATDISTIVTGKSLGHPVRSLKTLFSRNFAKMENDPNITPEEVLAFGGGALRKAVQEGDIDGSYMAGECAGMVKQIEPAAAIIEDIILGAEKVMKERVERMCR